MSALAYVDDAGGHLFAHDSEPDEVSFGPAAAEPRDERCAALARYGSNGNPLPEPRRCRVRARPGSAYCGVHSHRAAVVVSRGDLSACCVWCVAPGRRYTSDRSGGIAIVLCDECAKALAVATRGLRGGT